MKTIQNISADTVNIYNITINAEFPQVELGRAEDLTGQKFGHLTALYRGENLGKHPCWICYCSLTSRITKVRAADLKSGHTTSARTVAEAVFKHGHSRSNEKQTPTYYSWKMMIQRCTNPNAGNYSRYGGAGVTVCDRWLDFVNFLEDMGERPEGTSIDRIDPYGNYEPDNCRWADAKTQQNNQRERAA